MFSHSKLGPISPVNGLKCSLAHCGSNGVWLIMPEFYWVGEKSDSANRLD